MEHAFVHVSSFIESFEDSSSSLGANISLGLVVIAGAMVFDSLVVVMRLGYDWVIRTCTAKDALHNSGKLTSRKASFGHNENLPHRIKTYPMRILQRKLNGVTGNRPRHCHKLEEHSENERSALSSSDFEKRVNSFEKRMDEVATEIDKLQRRIDALTHNSSHGEHCPCNQVL